MYLLHVSIYWVRVSYDDLERLEGTFQWFQDQGDTELEDMGAGATTEVPIMTPCDLGQVI